MKNITDFERNIAVWVGDVIMDMETDDSINSAEYSIEKAKDIAKDLLSDIPVWRKADDTLFVPGTKYFLKTLLNWSSMVHKGEYYLTEDDFNKMLTQ
jgi:hypothetical protein